MKNLFDRFSAACGLILTLPLLLVLIPLVRLTSPGPAIFAQRRIGWKGREFICYKFRTMAVNTREAATHEISAAAVTGIGRILRKTKLDELPQLYNVLVGEMSLVGPRPCLPVQAELIRERETRGVLEILPGITGLGQVRGIDMSDPVRLAECDAEYLAKRSFGYDIRLLWDTLLGAGREDRVKPA
jgi:O-antigen biosynthesis protein WbqP